MVKTFSFFIRFVVCLIIIPEFSWAASVALPVSSKIIGKPSEDLISPQGKHWDAGSATAWAKQGGDLSILNPLPSKFWQDKKYALLDPSSGLPLPLLQERSLSYPEDGQIVLFKDFDNKAPFTFYAKVQNQKTGQYYRMAMSRYTQPMLLRSALMRKLGYFIPAPKYYEKLRVKFESKDQMERFLQRAQNESGSDFETRDWIGARDDQSFILTIESSTLEYTLPVYSNLNWGISLNDKNARQSSLIELMSRQRAYRAMIVPFVVTNIPESLGRYYPKTCGEQIMGNIVLTHDSAGAFRLTTYQDAKWIVRRMAQSLSKEDWDEMIEYAHYPKELEGWAKAKVLHCVDNLYKLFDVKQKYNYELPSLKISNQYLDKGKLTVERIPGYPQRFGHGDRESPIQDGDLFRYVKITGITSLIKEGLNKINEKLVIQGISDLADNRREELKKRVMKHIQEKPWEPLYLDVESWGGPVADISLNTSRHVTTGTFFGSTASIQLVDTVSAGFSLGYFRALDGLENFSPAAMGNVKVYRNYVHVKPVASLKEADSVDWTKIYVPNFMNGLGEGLITQFDMKAQCEKIAKENDEIIANHPQDSSEKPILKNCLHPFDEFMKQLKLGEVLTVTDSIGVGGFLSGTSNVATLMGLDPVSYVTNIRLGLDLQHVFLHQTVITRTKDGLQVSFRKGDDDIAGIQFDLNYFLNILRIRAEGKSSKLKSKVYVLDYNPDVSLTPAEFDAVSDEESKKEHIKHNDRRENLTASIRYVLLENDGELLGANFKDNQFGVDINLESQKVTTKFLWNKTEDFEEGEYLKLLYPANPDYPDLKPEDELVEVYSYRKGSLRGGDWLGLFSDVLDGWLEKSGVIASTDDPNPSNKPFGSANWRLITSETDLTRNGETYPSVSIIKDVWGGWKTSPDEFFAILNRINDKFSDLGSYNIIDINNFSSLKSIDFYRITASLAISESGMDKIKDLFQSAEYDNLDHKNLKNPHPVPLLLTLFERLATHVDLGVDYLRSGYQDPNHGKYLASDKVFYDRFLSLLGGGSLENGTRMYMQRCVEEHESDADMNPSHNISYRYQTLYECLSGWFVGFLQAKRGFPRESRVDQTEWMTLTLDELLKIIPLKNILEYIGKENYLLTVRVNGFRNGEEDGDLEFFGNTLGDPGDMFETANGVINLYSKDTGVLNTELYKSHGSFR